MPTKPVNLWGSLVGPTPSFMNYVHRGAGVPEFTDIINEIFNQGYDGYSYRFQEPTGSSVAVDYSGNGINAQYTNEGLTPEGSTQLGRQPFSSLYTASLNSSDNGGGSIDMRIPTVSMSPYVSTLNPRGPGTYILVYNRWNENINPLFVNGSGENGLYCVITDGSFTFQDTNGGLLNPTKAGGGPNAHLLANIDGFVNMLVCTVDALGNVVMYSAGEVVGTDTGWTLAPFANDSFGIVFVPNTGSFGDAKFQNMTWVADYVADQTRVTELWEALQQKELDIRGTFALNAAKSTALPYLSYGNKLLFFHSFEGNSDSISGEELTYSHDGSSPTWQTETLTLGGNGYVGKNGETISVQPRTGPFVGAIGVLSGTNPFLVYAQHDFNVAGHGFVTNDYVTLSNTIEFPGGSPLPSYDKQFAVTVLDADNFRISTNFGYQSGDIQATVNVDERVNDRYIAVFDHVETGILIDTVMDITGDGLVEARAGCVIRYVDADNYYYFWVSGTSGVLHQVLAGVDTQIASSFKSGGNTPYQRIKMELIGDVLSIQNVNYKYTVGESSVENTWGFTTTLANFSSSTTHGVMHVPTKNTSAWVVPTKPIVMYWSVLQPTGL